MYHARCKYTTSRHDLVTITPAEVDFVNIVEVSRNRNEDRLAEKYEKHREDDEPGRETHRDTDVHNNIPRVDLVVELQHRELRIGRN